MLAPQTRLLRLPAPQSLLFSHAQAIKFLRKIVQPRHHKMPHLIAQISHPTIAAILPPQPSARHQKFFQFRFQKSQQRPNHIALLLPYPPPCHRRIPAIQIHKKMLQIVVRVMPRRQPFKAPLPHHPSKKRIPQLTRSHLHRDPIGAPIPPNIHPFHKHFHAQLLRQAPHKLFIALTLLAPQSKIHVRHRKRITLHRKQSGHRHRIHTPAHRQQCRPSPQIPIL